MSLTMIRRVEEKAKTNLYASSKLQSDHKQAPAGRGDVMLVQANVPQPASLLGRLWIGGQVWLMTSHVDV